MQPCPHKRQKAFKKNLNYSKLLTISLDIFLYGEDKRHFYFQNLTVAHNYS